MREAITSSRAIPATRLGNAYRAVLVVSGLLAIVGVADAARALFWLSLNAGIGAEAPPMAFVKAGLRLAAWGLVALAAYTGWRRNAFPATWMLMGIVVLSWALILTVSYS